MRQRTILHVGVLAFLFSFTLGEVSAQDSLKQQLVGTWTLVSSTGKQPDGSSTWGDNPKSLLIFTADGRFSQAIMRADRKKFSANSRYQGTPEENASVVHGMIAYFGKYSVDESAKTISYQIEAASYPNWDGTTQQRPFTISGDQMTYTNPTPSGGGQSTELVWRRAK